MKPKNDFHIILWLLLILIVSTGCTTGIGALWRMHKEQESYRKWEKQQEATNSIVK